MEALAELSMQWYRILSALTNQLSGPVQQIAEHWNVPLLSAVLLGLLGSLAPCQMTANTGAIACLMHRVRGGNRAVWPEVTAYLLGKVAVYTLLGGLAILLGLRLPTWAMAGLRKVFGPMMILFGLYLLGWVRVRFTVGDGLLRWVQERLPSRQGAGAFLLGGAYSLAFCPTMALLFFGLLVPLGIQVPGGVLLPGLFALGTGMPLVLFAVVLSLGAGWTRGAWLRGTHRLDRSLRLFAGGLFLLAGINDTILYWLV